MYDLIIPILTSSVVATLVGVTATAYLDHRKSKLPNELDALKVSIALEGYVIECASELGRHNDHRDHAGHIGQTIESIPELPELAIGAAFLGWGKKTSVADDILRLPQAHSQARQTAMFWWQVAGDDEVANASAQETAKLALQALKLAADIRLAFKLPRRDLVFGQHDISVILERNLPDTTE